MQNLQYCCRRNIDDVTDRAIGTKFGTVVFFWHLQMRAMFHCPSVTVTLFSRRSERYTHFISNSPPVKGSLLK